MKVLPRARYIARNVPAPSQLVPRRMLATGSHARPQVNGFTTIPLPEKATEEQRIRSRVYGLDIGGTLTKLVYHDCSSGQSTLVCRTWKTTDFETECIPALVELTASSLDSPIRDSFRLTTTGGGAYRYGPRLKTLFSDDKVQQQQKHDDDPTISNMDEMVCLGAGLHFLQHNAPEEFYLYESTVLDASRGILVARDASEIRRAPLRPDVEATTKSLPMLLGNVGSGVSYLLCPPHLSLDGGAASDGESSSSSSSSTTNKLGEPRRVGGTPLGGGTIHGLLRLLTGEDDFEKLLELAARGDRTKVDLTVGDIYSKAYSSVGLSGDRAAAILGGIGIGKADAQSSQDAPSQVSSPRCSEHDLIQGYSKADIARSIVFGICYNVGLNAVLHAKINDTSNTLCFTGNLIQDNEMIMGDIDFGVQVNSNYKMRATFMQHGGYLGAIGAWVCGMQAKL